MPNSNKSQDNRPLPEWMKKFPVQQLPFETDQQYKKRIKDG